MIQRFIHFLELKSHLIMSWGGNITGTVCTIPLVISPDSIDWTMKTILFFLAASSYAVTIIKNIKKDKK